MAQQVMKEPKVDYKRTFRKNFLLIFYTGLWKYTGPHRLFYECYKFIVCMMYLTLLVTEFYAMILALPDIVSFNYIMCTFCLASLVYVKAVYLMPMADRLEGLQEYLNQKFDEKLQISRTPDHLSLATSRIHGLTKILGFLMVVTLIIWACLPFLEGTVRSFPLPFWLPFDIYRSPVYEIIYVLQVIIMVNAVSAVGGTDLMLGSFLLQAGAHYDIIACNLSEAGMLFKYGPKTIKDEKKVADVMKKCIHHHQIIRRLVNELNEIYWKPCTAHFTFGTLILCVVGFELFVVNGDWNVQLFSRSMYMCVALVDLFIYCAFGTLVLEKSENIAKAVYGMPWYEITRKEVKVFSILILTQARRPPGIVLARLFPLNCQTYLAMLKTAYSAFSLLRQVMSK